MEQKEIERLVYRILTTEDEEIDCGQLFELIARYVDLEVSGEEASRLLPMVHQHLEQCDACSELHDMLHELAVLEDQGMMAELDTNELLDDIVAGTPPGREQPSDLPEASAARAAPQKRGDQPTQVGDTVSRAPERRLRDIAEPRQPAPWLQIGWVLAAAAAVIAVVLGTWGWRQSTEMAETSNETAFIARADRAIQMWGTEEDPDASGFFFINEAEKRGLLVLDRLDSLPADRVYQMWIMSDSSEPMSAGTFTVEPEHGKRIWININQAPLDFARLAITSEPKGGSSKPTTSPVCVWGEGL